MQGGWDERDREGILRDLASEDEDLRRLALEQCLALPLGRALPVLVEGLGDPSWRVRKAAVERLVACPDTERVGEALVAALGDGENPGRRNSAVEALVRCGRRVLPALDRAAASPDADVRKFALDALAGIAAPESEARLLGALSDPDPNVRAAAVDALAAVGGESAGGRLLAAAADRGEDASVRFSALRALGALERPVTARELGPALEEPILRAAALELLGRAPGDEEATFQLRKGLAEGSRAVREAAMRSLLRVLAGQGPDEAARLVGHIREQVVGEPSVVDDALARLAEADLGTRLMLIQFLGLVGPARAVVPILRAGRDEALTEVALETLARFGPVAEAEVDAAWRELDAEARCAACMLFGRTSDERGTARLLAALDDPDPDLRLAALRGIAERRLAAAIAPLVGRLGRLAAADQDEGGEDETSAVIDALVAVAAPGVAPDAVAQHAIDVLRSRLDGATEPMRLAIARVVGCIGRRRDADLVAMLLQDPSSPVRRAAVEALARLEPGTAAEPLRLALADESESVRIAAAVALGGSESDAVVADLEGLAKDEDARVRAAALRSLSRRFPRIADADARAATLATLERGLADDALPALAAIEALTQLGAGAGDAVQRALARPEPELVCSAIGWISRHGDAGALDLVLPCVSHPDWTVRAAAALALAERGAARALPAILRRLELEQDEFVREAILRALDRLEG
jgi:HEAT repeat protein